MEEKKGYDDRSNPSESDLYPAWSQLTKFRAKDVFSPDYLFSCFIYLFASGGAWCRTSLRMREKYELFSEAIGDEDLTQLK